MVQRVLKKDQKFLRLLPLLANWIDKKRKLSDKELTAFFRQYPEHYDFKKNTSLDNMLEMASYYKDHDVFGKYIEIILSPEGEEWLKDCFNRIRKMNLKEKR